MVNAGAADNAGTADPDNSDNADRGDAGDRPEPPRSGSRRVAALDVVVGVALLALLALAPIARLAGSVQPQRPDGSVTLPTAPVAPVSGSAGLVRALPTGGPASVRIRVPDDTRAVAERALGASGAAVLIKLLKLPNDTRVLVRETATGGRPEYAPYPYRYPRLEQLLEQAPAAGRTPEAATLGAALVLLAARPGDYGNDRYPNAAPAAYAVLDRARETGSCAAQLNLLLLVAADNQPRDEVVRTEARRAAAMCPDEATSGWVLGEFQSQRALLSDDADFGDPLPPDTMQRAPATFADLTRRFPASPDVVLGAADAHVRAGLELAVPQPFTAHQEFRAAAAGYRRAAQLGAAHAAAAGLARALIGLGEPAAAAAMLRPELSRSAAPSPLLELVVMAEESAHHFAAAEDAARRQLDTGPAGYPDGPFLFPQGAVGGGPVSQADAQGPLSTGIDQFAPFTVDLQPTPSGAGASVRDGSFIPVFRVDGQTGSQPGCPSWSWRRDAVLAGHAREALVGFPSSFGDMRPTHAGLPCAAGSDLLAVTRLEAGLDAGTTNATDPTTLVDDRQNLWRWAGDLPRAEQIDRAWANSAGAEAWRPVLRLGEVEYLQRRYNAAAADFGSAARRAVNALDFVASREVMLDRGAALLAAGRRAEGIPLLRGVDKDASENFIYYQNRSRNSKNFQDSEFALRYAVVSFHARAQLGDAEREAGSLDAASEDYAAAREQVLPLQQLAVKGFRPEVVDANSALADLALGRLSDAEREISRARSADPDNPAFLMTSGFVADRRGQIRAAAQYDAATLASDSGAFPAANDLGVELARLHQDEQATHALRTAVAAQPGYALGWFNLGVLYARMGPAHLLASQGALGRAIALDPAFRDRKRQLTIDASTYRTGLDLSKPLPAHWSFADIQRRSPVAAAGLLAILLFGFTSARQAVPNRGRELADQWLELVMQRLDQLPLLRRIHRPLWAVAATVLALTLPLLRHPGAGLSETVAFTLGVLVLTVVAIRARTVIARRARLQARQEAWGVGAAFGLATGAAGAPWAPLPVIRAPEDTPRLHYTAPLVLAVLAVLLFMEGIWLHVPLVRSEAIAALIMTTSVLVPVKPLDGASIGRQGLVASAGVVGATVLVALGLI